MRDIDFKASTVRVDESSDQRTNGNIGPCKNAAAYRTVVLHDPEGKKSMRKLRHLLMGSPNAEALVFRSQRGGQLLETTILNQGLYTALKAMGLTQGHAVGAMSHLLADDGRVDSGKFPSPVASPSKPMQRRLFIAEKSL